MCNQEKHVDSEDPDTKLNAPTLRLQGRTQLKTTLMMKWKKGQEDQNKDDEQKQGEEAPNFW